MRPGRRALCLVLLAAGGASVRCAAPAPERAAPGVSVRVMSYNIRAGTDLERRSNLTRIAGLIDSLRADFVLLQEVDRSTVRSGRVDQVAGLASQTGLRSAFGRAMDYDGGEFGVAVLARWPLETVRVVPLHVAVPAERAAQPPEPRVLLHVIAAAPGGRMHVLTTHLDQGANPIVRQAQLFELLAYVADSIPRGERIVFGGDLNATPGAAEVRALGAAFDDAWVACGRGDGATFRSDRPERRIDYILLTGIRCSAAQVIDTRLSDHRPLVVDLAPQPVRRK